MKRDTSIVGRWRAPARIRNQVELLGRSNPMKLNQVIAIEKGIKSRVYGEITEMNKAAQKPALFSGFVKTYRKNNEDGEEYSSEQQKVQMRAEEILSRAAVLLTEMFDVTASKDYANCGAVADVLIDGSLILKDAPVTYLLFLEKQINDVRTFVENLPTLDEADDWNRDENTGLFKTAPIATHRTKKIQRPIVLYQATEHHPAQTQLITEDVLAGYWDTVKHSGAIPAPRKKVLLERIEKLSNAVKFAREAANALEARPVSAGKQIFDYLLQ
jgi:hypothetical protein